MATDRQRLLEFARRVLGTREDAEDAVQDTYVRALTSAGAAAAQPAWMHAVLKNIAIDGLRRRRLGPDPGEESSVFEAMDAAQDLESECEAALHHLLSRVSPVDAVILLLREVFEFDFDEIAPIIGKREPAIRQMLHRARLRSRRDEPAGEVDEYHVTLCWRAVVARDPEPLLHLLQTATAIACSRAPSTTPRGGAMSRLVQVNGRYAIALVLDGVVLCIVPVGPSAELSTEQTMTG